jgi:hypothetical protein
MRALSTVRWPKFSRASVHLDGVVFRAAADGGSLRLAFFLVSAFEPRSSACAACSPHQDGIGADPWHQEHRSPSTRLSTDAPGWRSIIPTSIARLVLHPRRNTAKPVHFGKTLELRPYLHYPCEPHAGKHSGS